MDISNELIDKLSDLAKLKLEGEEREKMKADLQNMVSFIDKLSEINTENVEPLIFMSNSVNILRDDTVEQTISHEEALLNAPKKDSDYFRVPKFIDK